MAPALRSTTTADRRRGFTVVELLVVIGIIAVLASLLLVGLRGGLATAAKSRELNALRNISLGWQMYAGGNNDRLLPGYLEPEVQNAWRLEWRTAAGETLPEEFAAPYTWRIASYVEFSWEVLVGYRDDAQKDLTTLPIDTVAFEPAFGYNAFYVGGWWESVTIGTNTIQAARYDLLSGAEYRGLVARTLGAIRRPSEMVVFSATTERTPGRWSNPERGRGVPGFHLATPGIVAEEERWQLLEGSVMGIDVLNPGPVPLNRHTSGTAVATADGGVSTLSFDELADQRRWINIADARDWTHPPN